MSRLVFLEWDEAELRALDMKSGIAGSSVQQATSVALPADSDDGPSKLVAAAITNANFGKAEAVVCVGRSGCQLRTLNVPRVPHEELPELVRFQAMRHFNNFNQDSAVDYVVLEESDAHGIEVLAAVISPELMAQVNETVEKAGLTLKRIVLRPFAAAEVVTKSLGENECVLIADRYAHEADLTVVRGTNVLTTRTIRIDGSLEESAAIRILRGEMLRTIAAARNEIENVEVSRVVMTGEQADLAGFQRELATELELPIDVIDPFDATNVSLTNKPKHAGRFASLLGAREQHFHESNHRVDFLNPRKHEEDHSGRKRILVWAGIAAAVVAALLFVAWLPIYAKSKKIDVLQKNVDNLEDSDTKNMAFTAETVEIDKWANREVIVLDELYYVSYNLPAPERAIVDSLHFRFPPRTDDPNVSITGRIKGSETVQEIESGLRDEADIHKVSGKTVQPVSGDKLYDHEFDETISIKKSKLPTRFNRKPAPLPDAPVAPAAK